MITALQLLNKMKKRKDFIVLLPNSRGGVQLVAPRDLSDASVDKMLLDILEERKVA